MAGHLPGQFICFIRIIIVQLKAIDTHHIYWRVKLVANKIQLFVQEKEKWRMTFANAASRIKLKVFDWLWELWWYLVSPFLLPYSTYPLIALFDRKEMSA